MDNTLFYAVIAAIIVAGVFVTLLNIVTAPDPLPYCDECPVEVPEVDESSPEELMSEPESGELIGVEPPQTQDDPEPQEVGASQPRPTLVVTRVIDGDTIYLSNGEKVRLVGINAPESGEPCSAESKGELERLVLGKTVELEKDISERDQYGRLLRYIYVDGFFVNEMMVNGGYAITYRYGPDTKYATLLEDAEDRAKSDEVGCLWQKSQDCIDCLYVSEFNYDAVGNDCDNLNGEYVVLRNRCDYACDLTGWTVKDEARHIYYFPEFELLSEAEVTLYTGYGTNSKTKLYWSSSGYGCNAIWNNDGDTLYLRDSDGDIVLIYGY
jgi:micrococcal nuclease